jgi:hypothetical protein
MTDTETKTDWKSEIICDVETTVYHMIYYGEISKQFRKFRQFRHFRVILRN